MDDLAEYKVRIEPPVTVNYHGYDLYSCGPWCQGPVLPQALKILEGFDLKAMGHNSCRVHPCRNPGTEPGLRG